MSKPFGQHDLPADFFRCVVYQSGTALLVVGLSQVALSVLPRQWEAFFGQRYFEVSGMVFTCNASVCWLMLCRIRLGRQRGMLPVSLTGVRRLFFWLPSLFVPKLVFVMEVKA